VHHDEITHEAVRAAKTFTQSRQAVASMFHEARMGKALNAKDALPIVEEISASGDTQPRRNDQSGAPEKQRQLHLHAFGGGMCIDGSPGAAVGVE